MPIKSVITEKGEKKEKGFPKLMSGGEGGPVVLVSEKVGDTLTGTVVMSPDATWYVGEHSQEWIAEDFVPFPGSITLSNED